MHKAESFFVMLNIFCAIGFAPIGKGTCQYVYNKKGSKCSLEP